MFAFRWFYLVLRWFYYVVRVSLFRIFIFAFFRLCRPYFRLFVSPFSYFILFIFPSSSTISSPIPRCVLWFYFLFSRLRQPHFRPFHVAFYSCFLYICKRLFPITPRVYFQLFILSAGFEWQKNTTCAWFSCTHCFCTGNFIASIRICWGWFYYCCNPLPYSCFCVLLVLLCSLFFVCWFLYFFLFNRLIFYIF